MLMRFIFYDCPRSLLTVLFCFTVTIFIQDAPPTAIPSQGSYASVYQPTSPASLSILSHGINKISTFESGIGYRSVKDLFRTTMPAENGPSLTTASPSPPSDEGPGGPILVITAVSNPYSRYTIELLKAEGLNEFKAMDISEITPSVLNNYDVAIVGEITLSGGNVADLTAWVNAGGTLIALKPDAQLASLLGITPVTGSLNNGYIKVNALSGPFVGIVNQTMQFHSSANLYTLNGATSLATLYTNSNTATNYPAVTSRSVGTNGGYAVAFSYDLAKSTVYFRQGNPAWAGQKRDGSPGPTRPDDMFFPNWCDFNKIAIPQADEQQRMLSNLIIKSNLHRKPLPRLWFLPKGLKAAVVMTGDDHGIGGTVARFNQYLSLSADNSPSGVADWNAVRGSSYIYAGSPMTDAQVSQFQSQGFEIGLHLYTGCADWTPISWLNDWSSQHTILQGQLPSMLPQKTHRTHCIAWSDYATQPKNELLQGIRLDVNYYYYPGSWVQDRPGMFTGSGIPMRFADLDGSTIDCYQVPTHLTDESMQNLPNHINSLLDNANGPAGYYGVFCANMHTDNGFPTSQSGSDAIVASAQAHAVPVVSAKQMLDWLIGRDSSSLNITSWVNNKLTFTINAYRGSRNMKALLPVNSATGTLTTLTYNGSPLTTTSQTIKGLPYVFFDATLGNGNYVATYAVDNTPPVITNVIVTPVVASSSATVTWATNKSSDSKVNFGTSITSLNLSAYDASLVTSHTITLTNLTPGTKYYFRVTSVDIFSNTSTFPINGNAPLNFTVGNPPCGTDQGSAGFSLGTTDAGTVIVLDSPGTVTLKPKLNDEFSGSTLQTGNWASTLFDATTGTITLGNGILTLSGSHAYSLASLTPGSSLEFVATFNNAAYQNIGLSADQAFDEPWVTIGEGSALDGNLYARSSDNVIVNLGANLIGSPHRYKIVWNTPANNFKFYVDGNIVPTASMVFTNSSPMYVQMSDFVATDGKLLVDWLRATPYAASGSFVSRVFDHQSYGDWGVVNWTALTPGGTSLAIFGRVGNTSVPDGAWSPFVRLTNGNSVGLTGRYIQYRTDMATTDNSLTPSLQKIAFSCADSNQSIVITRQPVSQTVCSGTLINLISAASGSPAPTIQWQVSTNGSVWTDSTGAVKDTLKFPAQAGNNGRRYRAVWTNSGGSVNSNVATITVNTTPTATISAVNPVICQGRPVQVRLTAATGIAPYKIVVNGVTYSGVNVGQIFANFQLPEKTIWDSAKNVPGTPNSNDGVSLEVGVKFRSNISGLIKGIRYYKGAGNTGAHTGSLWTSTGTLLATAAFSSETTKGWQEVRFSAPVYISPNTTYIASYYSPNGGYALDDSYFVNGAYNIVSSPLTALQSSGINAPNGVFKYGGGYPTDDGNDANYWADAVFEAIQTSSQSFIYKLTAITDANGCSRTGTSPALDSTIVTVNPMPTGNITARANSFNGSPVSLTYNATTGTAPFSLLINGIAYGNITSGSPFNAGVLAGPANSSIWLPSVTGGSQTGDNSPVELGMSFTSSSSGFISGVRFYKTDPGVFNFTGSLWAGGNTAAPLATSSYTSDNTAGWKQINFASPVAIDANTSYIATYSSGSGNHYAFTSDGLNVPVSNPPLTAQAGLFGPPGGYPNTTSTNNYWVDVAFNTSPANTFNLTSITDANGCNTSGNSLNCTNLTVGPSPDFNYVASLTDLSAAKKGSDVQLEWSSASEQKNNGYEIQESRDGSSWKTIGFVKSAQTSPLGAKYQYLDKSLPLGKYYYRLNQISIDGRSALSRRVSVTLSDQLMPDLRQNHPNPFESLTTITIVLTQTGRIKLTLYDQMGRPLQQLLDETKNPGTYQVQVNRKGLSTGIYYYKLDTQGQSLVRKMTIM